MNGPRPPRALTVAGSDSGGGAGIEADLKTFAAHGVWGLCAITAVTAQNTLGVQAAEVLAPALVEAQIESVASDIGVDALKTGMLGNAAVVRAVAAAVRRLGLRPLVVDPVAVASTGAALLAPDGFEALRADLVPLADLVTPNMAEAAALTGLESVDDRAGMVASARALVDLGARAVLVTGGHLPGPVAADLLLEAGGAPVWLEGPRLEGRHNHGTGCVLSAALAARLARGEALPEALDGAKAFVTRAIAAGLDLGGGVGPVNPQGPA